MKKFLKWFGIIWASLMALGILSGILFPSESTTENAGENPSGIFTTTETTSFNNSQSISSETITATQRNTSITKTTLSTTAFVPVPLVTTTSKNITTTTAKTIVTKATQPKPTQEMVWIPTNGGKRYHKRSNCSKMINPEYVTLDEAKSRNFTACGICYK